MIIKKLKAFNYKKFNKLEIDFKETEIDKGFVFNKGQ